VSIADIHFGVSGVSPGAGTLAPVPHGKPHEQQADQELDPVRRVGRAAAGRDVPGVGDEVDDSADDCDSDDPADGEHRSVDAGPSGEENEDHRDDRHRADGDADRERENLADGLAHIGLLLS
jgi:hypothetical protein